MMRNTLRIFAITFLPFLAADAARAADPAPTATPNGANTEFFETKIRPVLVESCYSCHSDSAKKLKANFRVDSRASMLKGGDSDTPAIVPNKPQDSNLLKAIKWSDEDLKMPPKQKLSAAQIQDFETWIKQGAPMPSGAAASATTAPAAGHPKPLTLEEGRKFWSFIPPREPTTKPTDIDHFINAKLEENHLTISPQADKRTLIRRATFDLTGLPPTLKQIEAFENDASPDAYAKVIDRLLASPQYGERWARHWMDIARYSDTKGYVFEEERRYAFAYTYRDWLIRALNQDLPYDQFLIQQIAADRLDLKGDKRPLAALGFLTLGRRFLNSQPEIIDDRIDVVCRGTMALTVGCARCHDHKYDPIPTADYYSLYGVFASTVEPAELPFIGGDKPPKSAEFEAELAKRRAELEKFTATRFGELRDALRTKPVLVTYLLAAQDVVAPHPFTERFEVPDDVKGLSTFVQRHWEEYLKSKADKNDDVFAIWRKFAAIPPRQFQEKAPAVFAECKRNYAANPIIARILLTGDAPKSLREVAERYATALVAFDQETSLADPEIEAIRLFMRGPDSPLNVEIANALQLFGNVDRNHQRDLRLAVDSLFVTHPGSPPRAMAVEDAPNPVAPHIFLRGNAANVGKEVPRQFPAILASDNRKPFAQGSGRLELAQAIASKANPLTARVIVNRLWQYHFGYGLVRTPSDFGTRGSPPSHPELLDWLALRFENDDAWSLKKLHRRIMMSAAYKQQSLDRLDARQIDPENKLLWRQNRQRLDFESMRDSLLAASGQIDLTQGGQSVDIFAEPFIPRRSLYAFIDRQNLPGTFRTFDLASPDATSGQRFNTTVPQQALFMMNSPFVIQQSRSLIAHAAIDKQPEPAKRVAEIYKAALGRSPTKNETDLALHFVDTEQSIPAAIAAKSIWKYGYGEIDEATQHVASFYPFPHWNGTSWNGSETWPDPKIGWATLTDHGGHPGDAHHAVIRRWIAPRDCTVSITGKLAHNSPEGDGVRGRIVTPRDGVLAAWITHQKSADTNIHNINIRQGEPIDFVVDCGRAGDNGYDGFAWTVMITKEAATDAVAGDDATGTWNSETEFAGPATTQTPLSPWEKLAQVLLESNEFAFVD